jgi:hypothetical protein
MESDNFAKLWKSHIDKLASRAGSPKDLISILSARGSQHSYTKANPEVSSLPGNPIHRMHVV